jgi:hypothetical protein
MSNRRKFIKQSVLGSAGLSLSTILTNESYAFFLKTSEHNVNAGDLVRWGYTIGQREIPTGRINENVSDFKVYPKHPRLFFRDTDLPTIRQRIKKDFSAEWQEMLHDLDTRALAVPAATFAQGKYLKRWTIGRNAAFVAAVTGEERYVLWAKQWAEAMAASGLVGIDDDYRGRLQSLAVAYDWLYPWLSGAEKKRLQDAVLQHIDKNWYFAEGLANYVGGHSRWGNFALLAGLLSLVSERPELYQKLLVVRNHWVNGFHKVQGWIAKDGGYHMGWSYSAAYLTMYNHCVLSSATNECVYYSWQGLLPLFWIYGKQGDGIYPNTGDAYFVEDYDLRMQQDLMMIGAGVFKNPHAAWIAKERTDPFADILYGDKRVRITAPDDSHKSLPLSKYFRNAGVVIIRDRWDEKTTNMQFRSVSFYSANHHHRDENSFTLHYKGGLAIDSGSYYWYGSEHWLNYFTRTIAHNAIVVFDPEQKMTIFEKLVSNDGGQTYRKEPSRFEDILPGGNAELTGIKNFYYTDEYTYSSGDASKAYDLERVRLVQREIVYLRATSRPHPIVVIFDRVESTKPEFKKKFLLHTVNEPVINGKFTIAENKGGRLSCLTLFPEDANLELIGGLGKEAWVDGKNYPFEGYGTDKNLQPMKNGQPVESGAWRLEVSPGSQQTKDYFLHVLFVDDADAHAVRLSEAKLVRDESSLGVIVGGWNVTFPLAAGKAGRVERVL